VVVNRVFGEEVGGYFGAWRENQREQIELVESGFNPVPVLRAPYFETEVVGTAMLDRLGEEIFAGPGLDAAAILHDSLAHEFVVQNGHAELRLDLPFAHKGDLSVKKVGTELVVRADGHKRTIALPPTMADHKPAGATFTDGRLVVRFDG